MATSVDASTLPPAIKGCEEVYHLASPTHRSADAASTIVDGTRNVLTRLPERKRQSTCVHEFYCHYWILHDSRLSFSMSTRTNEQTRRRITPLNG